MAYLLNSLLSVFFPTKALGLASVYSFSFDEEDENLGDEDKFFGGDVEEDEDPWFPGDDENGDDDLGFGNDEDYNY